MKKTFFILSAVLICQAASGQVLPQVGARSGGLANTSLCLDDVWSVYNNPGAFGMVKKSSAGLAYENRFLLRELNTQALVVAYHTEKSGNFGLHFQQYGFDLYREMQGGLTYGLSLAPNFSMGVSMNYHRIRLAENYGSANVFSGTFGLMYQLNKDLQLGVRIQNISRSKLAAFNDERMPTTLAIGGRFLFSEKASWSFEAEKDLVYPINIKSGLEIQAHDILVVRLGVNSFPFQSAFGIGLHVGSFSFDLDAQWHTQLGISPGGALTYSF